MQFPELTHQIYYFKVAVRQVGHATNLSTLWRHIISAHIERLKDVHTSHTQCGITSLTGSLELRIKSQTFVLGWGRGGDEVRKYVSPFCIVWSSPNKVHLRRRWKEFLWFSGLHAYYPMQTVWILSDESDCNQGSTGIELRKIYARQGQELFAQNIEFTHTHTEEAWAHTHIQSNIN